MYQPPTPPSMPPHTGLIALRFGLIAGIALGLIESGILVYTSAHIYIPLAVFSIPFSLLLWVIALLVSGIITARRTGKVLTGTLTGLWAGLSAGVVTACTWFMLLISPFLHYGYGSLADQGAVYLTLMIVLILGALGLGTGLGALGGLIGQSFATQHIPAKVHYQHNEPLPSSWHGEPPQQELFQYQHIENSQRERSAE